MQIDMFTAVICFVASSIVALVYVVSILKNNRSFSPGIKYFIYMYILLIIGPALIILRGIIPVFFSIILSNAILLSYNLFLIKGISRLLEKKYNPIGIIIIIAIATLLLGYFTYYEFNLQARIIVFAFANALINFILVLYLLRRNIRENTGAGGFLIITTSYMLLNGIRIPLITFFDSEAISFMNLRIDPFIILIQGLFSLVIAIALISIISGIKTEKMKILSDESAFFAKIYEITPTAILVARSNDSIMYLNQALCDLTMQQSQSVIGSDWITIFIPDNQMENIRNSIRKARGRSRIYHSTDILKYDGTRSSVELFIELHYDEFDILDYYFVFIHDLTLINRIQKRAIESERQKNSILSNIPGFTYRCHMDRNWTMIELSGGFYEMTGYDPRDFIGNKKIAFNDIILDDFKDEVWETWNQCCKEGEPYIGEYKIKLANGESCWVWEHGRVVEIHSGEPNIIEGFITNINRRKLLEEKSRQIEAYLQNQQKLEAIGTLAAGVAHEINNPINGIMNYAQLISDMNEGDFESGNYAREIIAESERISNIVNRLLQFSGHQDLGPKLTDISGPIQQTIDLFVATTNKDSVEVETSFEPEVPEVVCNCAKMQQVLMNLLTNARDSLNKKYGMVEGVKKIHVKVRRYNDKEGKWLRVAVEDNGNGIPLSIQPLIFEPFFTTKDRANEKGLGLAVSFGIVKDHKGRMSFRSKEGEGATFFIDIPIPKI